jgi:hypothetical protein
MQCRRSNRWMGLSLPLLLLLPFTGFKRAGDVVKRSRRTPRLLLLVLLLTGMLGTLTGLSGPTTILQIGNSKA